MVLVDSGSPGIITNTIPRILRSVSVWILDRTAIMGTTSEPWDWHVQGTAMQKQLQTRQPVCPQNWNQERASLEAAYES